MIDLSNSSAPANSPDPISNPATHNRVDQGNLSWTETFFRCGVLLALSLAVLIAYWVNPPVYASAKPGVVLELPGQVDDYHSLKGEITLGEKEILAKDTEFARREYFNTEGDDILSTIVLSGAGQNSIHRPEVCLPGQGWTTAGSEDISIQLKSGHTLVVRCLNLERSEDLPDHSHHTFRRYYMYWFVGEGVTTSSHLTRVLLSSWDRVVHNRAHRWAFVIATSAITEDERIGGRNADQTKAMLVDFVRDIVPSFQKSEMIGNNPQ